jgi:ribonuclease T1
MVGRSLRNRAAAWATALCGVVMLVSGSATYARNSFSGATDPSELQGGSTLGSISVSQLPRQAVSTLTLIAQGGPFPYSKDGAVFGNFERQLPRENRGYYREYTVPTPRARNRGARRIICGGSLRSTTECYYTGDHYASFKRIVG